MSVFIWIILSPPTPDPLNTLALTWIGTYAQEFLGFSSKMNEPPSHATIVKQPSAIIRPPSG